MKSNKVGRTVSKLLAIVLVFAMVIGMAPVTLAKADGGGSVSPVTATVNFTAQAGGAFLIAPQYNVSVSSDLAESYGYEDQVASGSAVSALDVLVKAHQMVFGSDFTAASKEDYLVVPSGGFISKQFGVETTAVGFAVNGGYPNDGTESEWGGFNGTTVTTTAVSTGSAIDTFDFFNYQDDIYCLDNYSYIEIKSGATQTDGGYSIAAGGSLSVMAKGFCYAYDGYNYLTSEEAKAAATALEGIGFSWVDAATGELTEIKDSSNNAVVSAVDGSADITAPSTAGTYYLTASGTDDSDCPVIMNPIKVVVTAAPAPTPEPTKTINIKAAPKTVNLTFYNADGTVELSSGVTDNGLDSKQQYHLYTLDLPVGNYVFKGTDDGVDIGGSTLTISESTQDNATFTLMRVNFYYNYTGTEFSETGKWTLSGLKNAETGKPAILGPQYVSSGMVYQPTVMIAGVNYDGGSVTINDPSLLNDFYLKTFSAQKVTANYTVQKKTLPIAKYNTFTLTAPTEATAKFYNQTNNYVVTPMSTAEMTTTDNGDGTTTYKFKSQSTNFGAQYSYRFTMDGKVTQAGYMVNNGSAVITFPADKTPSELNSVINYDDNSILLNVTAPGADELTYTNELKLAAAGDTFSLRAFRAAWQIVDTAVANHMIEPDFHYEVIEGSDVVSVTPIANEYESGKTTGNAKDNWATVTALKNGTALIKVWYDAIDIQGSSVGEGTYGATDPARYGIVAVKVGDSSTLDWKPMSADGNWDSEFDTLYYEGTSGTFRCQPAGVTSMSVCNINGSVKSEWQNVSAGPQGIYNVPVKTGANVIKAVTANGTSFMIVRAKQITVTIKNNTTGVEGTNANPPAITVGDSVTVSFGKLDMPIPKMSGVYNPGYLGTAKTAYMLNGNVKLFSAGTQYDFSLSDKNSITFTALASGTNKLTAGYIDLSSMGDPFGNHRRIDESGKPVNLNAGEIFGKFGSLPDVSFNVADDPSYDYAALYNEVTGITTTSNKTILFYGASLFSAGLIIRNQTPGYTVTWSQTTEYMENQPTWSFNAKVTSTSNYNTIDLKYWYENETPVTVRLENGIQKVIDGFVADASKKLYIQIIVTPADSRIGAEKVYAAYVVNAKVGSGSASGGSGSGSGDDSGSGTGGGSGVITPPSDITVNVTVLGDSAHGDNGTAHTLTTGSLANWYSGSVTIPAGSTVKAALAEVEANSGLSFIYSGSNYISAVYYNGVILSEFTNGMNSGWMYTRNGSHPNLGVAEQTLSNGDSIVFHYTDDWTLESDSYVLDDGGTSGNSGTGGAGGAGGAAGAKTGDKAEGEQTTAENAAPEDKAVINGVEVVDVAAMTADEAVETLAEIFEDTKIEAVAAPETANITEAVKATTATNEDGKQIFVDENGEVVKDAFVEKENGKKSFVDENGEAVKNTVIAAANPETGKTEMFYTNAKGNVVTDKVIKLENGEKMIAKENGAIATNEVVTAPNGKTYFAGADGLVVKSAVIETSEGTTVITNKNGVIVKNAWVEMDGVMYKCNKKGVVTKTKPAGGKSGKKNK